MKKGKYGVYLWLYAVVAFVLAFLNQILLCGLLLGFVIAAERDEWLSRQVIQAFFLAIFGSVISSFISILDVFYNVPLLGSVISTAFGVVSSLISILILVFVIIALVRTAKGQDAAIPGFSKLAAKALGFVEQKAYPPQQPPQNPPYPPQPPQNPPYPPQQAPQQPYTQVPPQQPPQQ